MKKRKAILWSVSILLTVTCVLVFTLSMVSAKSQKKPADKKSAAKITADEVALPDDGEKRTSREILDEIINVGCQERAAQKDKAESVRHEISREKYETCGYDSGYVMVKYSDGSFEIVEE